jgi:hypothetical protein
MFIAQVRPSAKLPLVAPNAQMPNLILTAPPRYFFCSLTPPSRTQIGLLEFSLAVVVAVALLLLLLLPLLGVPQSSTLL